MPTSHKYNVGDIVYSRSSASIGHLEAFKISGVYLGDRTVYTVMSKAKGTNIYGDRKSAINNSVLYFSEDEFILMPEALQIAKIYAENLLGSINNKIEAIG